MGNREELLAGAKRCVVEKGYAHTTARDIASASGVSLAAIGYHFGSKDALMNQAVYELIGEWGEELQRALTAEGALDGDMLQRFESVMGRMLESFGGPGRGLWAAQVELVSLMDHNEELRRFLTGVQGLATDGMAEIFLGIDPAQDPETARLAGFVLHTIFIGLMVRWFIDSKQVPSAHELAEGMKIVAERMLAGHPDERQADRGHT
jgi:AcrR family transcriptional regulator